MGKKNSTITPNKLPQLPVRESKPFDKEAFIKNAKKLAAIYEKEKRLEKQNV